MFKIKLDAFMQENIPRRGIDNGQGWAEWRALDLVDETTGNHIAEWFYAVACNKYYFDKKNQSLGNEPVGYFIQEEFSETELLRSAQSVVNELSFKSWDDFYEKMSKRFIYEED